MSHVNTVALTTFDLLFKQNNSLDLILYRLLLYKLHVAEPDSAIECKYIYVCAVIYKCNKVCVCVFKGAWIAFKLKGSQPKQIAQSANKCKNRHEPLLL